MINIKKLLLFLFILTFFYNSNIFAKDLERLKKLFDEGIITEKEFKKAISLIENKNKSNISKDRIKIRKLDIDPSGTKFERLEFYIDNYRVYTQHAGAVKFVNMLTGETDVMLKDNFKSEFTANGKKFFKLELDREKLEAKLKYKGRMLINWTGKFVSKHQASFYQMQVLGYMPFHFFIKLKKGNAIALNADYFTAKIDKAVAKAKKEIASKYNLTVADIDRILEKKEMKIDSEIDKIITDEQEKIIRELTEKYAGQEIDDQIRAEIEKTIGEEMANALITAIEDVSGQAIDAAIEAEIAAYINEAIAWAIEEGVSQAAAEAAIAAMLWVYAMGGTDEQAMEACRKYAGDAC